MQIKPVADRPTLSHLIREATMAYNAMTPEQKEEMHRQQRESWVRGEMELSKLERETTVILPNNDEGA